MKTYVQIGANVGGDEFQSMVGSSSERLKVFLVEPNTDLHPQLMHSYSKLNHHHDITVCGFGIALDSGTQAFYQYGDIHGNYSLLNRDTHPLRDSATVKSIETKTFEEFCNSNNLSEIECLYIDTEGLDYEILSSIDLSKIDIKVIIFEEWRFDNDDRNEVYRSGPKFLEEVIMPKYSGYKWSKSMLNGDVNYKLVK